MSRVASSDRCLQLCHYVVGYYISINKKGELKIETRINQDCINNSSINSINANASYYISIDIGKKKVCFDKEKIKEAVKEAIAECGGITTENKGKENNSCVEHELPNEIFNMFDNL